MSAQQCESGECLFGLRPCPNKATQQVHITHAGTTYTVHVCDECAAKHCPTSVTGEHLWVNYGGRTHTDIACFACFEPQQKETHTHDHSTQ